MDILVRFATQSDIEFVSQDKYTPVDIVARKIEWREVVIAELEGTPVGYARIEYIWSQLPFISLIHVLPETRRQGVGKAILLFLESYLVESGHDALYSSSQVDESPPQAWHRCVGFVECGVIAGMNEDGIGELFFRKRLQKSLESFTSS